ncbi:MAG: polyketide cyclase [Alphaproteobacteria bacterium]|nr:polyketide cyclase [Alphaproteobacteria bacterium]
MTASAPATRVRHATLTFERTFKASPDRVFDAWADPAKRMQWDVPGENWVVAEHRQDFRLWGEELTRFGPKDNAHVISKGCYLDIARNRRIISAGVMHGDGQAMTATMCTIEITPNGDGSKLTLTDQSAFFGWETEDMRREGFGQILDRLGAWLAR